MTQVPELSVAEQRRLAKIDERRPRLRERVYVDGEGHDLVGEDVRCDREWEDAHADQVRGEWADSQDERRRQRDAERRAMTDGQRLDRALMEIELGTGRRARRIEAARSTGDDRNPGGKRPTHVEGVDVEPHLAVIRLHLRAIEEALDAELGLIQVAPEGRNPGHVGGIASGRLSTAQRDALIFDELQGVAAQQVADDFPWLAGSARTVQRARRSEGDRRRLNVRLTDGVVLGEMTPEQARRADERSLTPDVLLREITREAVEPRRLRRVVIDERLAA